MQQDIRFVLSEKRSALQVPQMRSIEDCSRPRANACSSFIPGEDLLETVVCLKRHVILVKISRELDADIAVVPCLDVVTCLINPLLLEASYESEFVTVLIDPHTCSGLAELVEDLVLTFGCDIEGETELVLGAAGNSILTNRESDASKISGTVKKILLDIRVSVA